MADEKAGRFHWMEEELFCENCQIDQILWLVDDHRETLICLGPIVNGALMETLCELLNKTYEEGCAHGAGS